MLQIPQQKVSDICTTVSDINVSDKLDSLASKFMQSFQNIVQFDQASFFLYEKSKGYYCPASINIPDKYLNEYREYYYKVDEVTKKLSSQKSYRYSDILPINKMMESETYIDHFKPMGAFYTQGINLFYKEEHMGIVTLFREKSNRNFTKDEQFLIEIFHPHLVNKLVEMKSKIVSPCPLKDVSRLLTNEFKLTQREIEIVKLILEGKTNKEISDSSYIQLYTVKTHIKNIFRKLNISNRSQIMRALTDKVNYKV